MIAEQRINTLISYYVNKGYKVTVIWHSLDENIISIVHPNYGKMK